MHGSATSAVLGGIVFMNLKLIKVELKDIISWVALYQTNTEKDHKLQLKSKIRILKKCLVSNSQENEEA